MAEPASWRGHAACKDASISVGIFFPRITTGSRSDDPYSLARQVCARCPVRSECLEDALSVSVRFDLEGMYGGKDPRERRSLRRSRARARRTKRGDAA